MVEYKSFLLFIQQKSQMYCNITFSENTYFKPTLNKQKNYDNILYGITKSVNNF